MSPEFLVDEELDFLQISLRLLINFVKAFYCTVKFFDSTKWLLLRYVCIGLTWYLGHFPSSLEGDLTRLFRYITFSSHIFQIPYGLLQHNSLLPNYSHCSAPFKAAISAGMMFSCTPFNPYNMCKYKYSIHYHRKSYRTVDLRIVTGHSTVECIRWKFYFPETEETITMNTRNKKQTTEIKSKLLFTPIIRTGLSRDVFVSFSPYLMEDKDKAFILSLTWLIPVKNEQMGFSVSPLHLIPFSSHWFNWAHSFLWSFGTAKASVTCDIESASPFCKACFYYCFGNWYSRSNW